MSTGKIVAIHSYRGGTGKSNVTANLAAAAVKAGKRVAVLDTDIQSPGVHVLFNFKQSDITLTLVDFLWGKCEIGECAYDVTQRIEGAKGKLWLVPASMTTEAITRLVDEGYDVQRLNSHFDELISELELDYLFIDTHPGLNRETLLTTAISDVLVLLVRPDQQDYFGTAVIMEVAGHLETPYVFLVANKVFSHTDTGALKQRLEDAFHRDVIGLLPLSEDLARLESRKLMVCEQPQHEVSQVIGQVATRILSL